MWTVTKIAEGRFAVTDGVATLTFVHSTAVKDCEPVCVVYRDKHRQFQINRLDTQQRKTFDKYKAEAIIALTKYLQEEPTRATS